MNEVGVNASFPSPLPLAGKLKSFVGQESPQAQDRAWQLQLERAQMEAAVGQTALAIPVVTVQPPIVAAPSTVVETSAAVIPARRSEAPVKGTDMPLAMQIALPERDSALLQTYSGPGTPLPATPLNGTVLVEIGDRPVVQSPPAPEPTPVARSKREPERATATPVLASATQVTVRPLPLLVGPDRIAAALEATHLPAEATFAAVEAKHFTFKAPIEAAQVPVSAAEAPARAREVPPTTTVSVKATQLPVRGIDAAVKVAQAPVTAIAAPEATRTPEATQTLEAKSVPAATTHVHAKLTRLPVEATREAMPVRAQPAGARASESEPVFQVRASEPDHTSDSGEMQASVSAAPTAPPPPATDVRVSAAGALPIEGMGADATSPHAWTRQPERGLARMVQLVRSLEHVGPMSTTSTSNAGKAPAQDADAVNARTPSRAGTPVTRVVPNTAVNEPIRLHADWFEDGVRLWLGMDATAAADLQSITAHLQRWMAAQGVPLLGISCNGRLIVEGGPNSRVDSFDAVSHSTEVSSPTHAVASVAKPTPPHSQESS